jgi:hypothetical protein
MLNLKARNQELEYLTKKAKIILENPNPMLNQELKIYG